jgi:uncharacterized protein GlcG (DUF336 family)
VDLRSSRRPTLETALALLERVRAEGAQRGVALAAAVVDDAGNLIASQRMDDAALGALPLAIGKAYTAVLWGAATRDFASSTQPGGDDWAWNTTDPRIVVYPGGIPLLVDGALVGGLGASGAAAAQDDECVVAAARALGFDDA